MRHQKYTIVATYTRYQVFVISLILLLLIGNSIFLYVAEFGNAEAETGYQINSAVGEVNARIQKVEEGILEVLTTITGNYDGLWSNESGRKSFDKLKLKRLMASKQMVVSDMEYFFVIRPGDFTVFQAPSGKDIFERLSLREYVENDEKLQTRFLAQREWYIYEVGGRKYLGVGYYYSYADIYVGVMVEPEILLKEIYKIVEENQGVIELTDTDLNTLTYSCREENSRLGTIVMDTVILGDDFEMRSEFTMNYLLLLKNNVISLVVMSLVLLSFFVYTSNRWLRNKIVLPVLNISDEIKNISDVSQLNTISELAEIYEIRHLAQTINTLLTEAVHTRIKLYEAELRKKEQDLNMLRAQIRPHFFLNAISTVNAMTYQERNEDIRDYLLKLSAYLRYVINNEEKTVTIREELDSINNYFGMQEIRFPEKTMNFINCVPEAENVRLPRFILLTVIENAFKYAMSVDKLMEVLISCTMEESEDFKGVLILIEDNGPGFTEENIAFYNESEFPDNLGEEHIGLSNVKRTLALHYGKKNLMRISNVLPTGARIEIRIPQEDAERYSDDSIDRGR